MLVGKILIAAGCVLAATGMIAGLSGRRELLKGLLTTAMAASAAAATLLLVALLGSNFWLDYVVRHTSRDLPMIYKVAAFWAGQEGTVLLWTLLLEAVALGLLETRNRALQVPAATALAAMMFGFTLLLVVRSPFAAVTDGVPADGHGLNPLLRNPWMVVHPPVLFLGYALLAAPFALALAAFGRGESDDWVVPARPWLLAGWVALGAGMMLGGYWAYITLGWGGFWAWDPVENSSLIPWLFATALIHGLLLQQRCGAARRMNYVLAMLSFVSVVYGSYLTRSGVLGDFSVHSFESLGQNYNAVWLVLLAAPLAAGISVLVRHQPAESALVPTQLGWMPHAVWVLVGMATFVLVGTSAPLITSLVGHGQAVEQSFYNRTQTVFFAFSAILLLLAVTPRTVPGKGAAALLALAAGAAAANLVNPAHEATVRLGLVLLAACCGLMAAIGGQRTLVAARLGQRAAAGAGLAHLGAALLVLGAVLSGPGERSEPLMLKVGETKPAAAASSSVTYLEKGTTADGKTRFALRLADGRTGHGLMFETNNGQMRNPAIFHGWSGDIYLEPEELSEATGGGETVKLAKGEKKQVAGLSITFEKFEMGAHGESGDVQVGAVLAVDAGSGPVKTTPKFIVGDKGIETPAETVAGRKLRVAKVMASEGAIELAVESSGAKAGAETLVLRVTRKPVIWLVWLGTVILLAGGVISSTARREGQVNGRTGTKGRAS